MIVGVREAGLQAEVVVRYEDRSVELQVVETGTQHGDFRTVGHGLVGMRERATMFGGELDAAPAEMGGLAVRACLPLAPPPAT